MDDEHGERVLGRVDALIDLFNRRSLDIPGGLFDRNTRFVLNGTAFDEMLGRPPGDPLARLIACGAGGYRFAVKALQHAVPDARVSRGAFAAAAAGGAIVLHGECRIQGRPRGDPGAIDAPVRVRLALGPSGIVSRAEVDVDEPVLARLRAARARDG